MPADLFVINSFFNPIIESPQIALKPEASLVILCRDFEFPHAEYHVLDLTIQGWKFVERITLTRTDHNSAIKNDPHRLRNDGFWLRFVKGNPKLAYVKMPKRRDGVWAVGEYSPFWYQKILDYLCPPNGLVMEYEPEDNFLQNACGKKFNYERAGKKVAIATTNA